jgi:hypothetical protein
MAAIGNQPDRSKTWTSSRLGPRFAAGRVTVSARRRANGFPLAIHESGVQQKLTVCWQGIHAISG